MIISNVRKCKATLMLGIVILVQGICWIVPLNPFGLIVLLLIYYYYYYIIIIIIFKDDQMGQR